MYLINEIKNNLYINKHKVILYFIINHLNIYNNFPFKKCSKITIKLKCIKYYKPNALKMNCRISLEISKGTISNTLK